MKPGDLVKIKKGCRVYAITVIDAEDFIIYSEGRGLCIVPPTKTHVGTMLFGETLLNVYDSFLEQVDVLESAPEDCESR